MTNSTLRVSSPAKNVRFFFSEKTPDAQPTVRLRYKLEGHDDAWRDLTQEHGMKVAFQFWDSGTVKERRVIGGEVYYLNGETPGWRGTAERSDFISRSATSLAPGRSASVKIVFISDGYSPAIGLVAIDAVHLRIEHPEEDSRVDLYDLNVTQGTDLNDPMGRPVNWIRQGAKPELAQLQMRPDPVPHPILVLNDTSARYFAAWVTDAQLSLIPVHPGDKLTLTWQTAHSVGGCSPGEAVYKDLPPGNYRFRVSAAKANGELTGDDVSLPLRVFIPIYHHWGFWMVFTTLACGGVVWLGLRMAQRRLKWRLTELERQNVLEHERARIARDLHDDIGAGLTEIAMQSDWVRRDLANGPTADTHRRIERVCQSAIELTRSVDEIVWAVNPANDTLDRFANYLSQTTKQFLDAAGLRMRFDLPQEIAPTPMAGKTRHCLFLAVREALNNAVKHAHADLIKIELRLGATDLCIAVEDNGCGFLLAESSPSGTHEGLENMRLRMEEISGRFNLTSNLGKGTKAEFIVPL
ncbi:MAG: histidine kinase [bacterium]